MGTDNKKHLLFVCTANMRRSPTAAALFDDSPFYIARSAGTGLASHLYTHISQELIDWADIIFVMNEKNEGHRTYIEDNYDVKGKEIRDLDVPDRFTKDAPGLVETLKYRLKDYLTPHE